MEAVVAAETVGTMMIVDHITEMAIVTAMNKTEVAEAVRAVGQLKVLFLPFFPFTHFFSVFQFFFLFFFSPHFYDLIAEFLTHSVEIS